MCKFKLNLDKYQGIWYEVGKYPTPYQIGCEDSMAIYKRNDFGGLEIINLCFRNNEIVNKIMGKADPTEEPNRLSVKFNGGFSGDYIVLWTDYKKFSFVTTSDRQSFWVLSRYRAISDDELKFIYQTILKLGFDLKQFQLNQNIL